MTDLKPGPEMDALVAEALGLDVFDGDGRQATRPGSIYSFGLPRYSTDLGEAVKALEEFCDNKERKFSWDIKHYHNINVYGCKLYRAGRHGPVYDAEIDEQLPVAICRAIVEAAGEGK